MPLTELDPNVSGRTSRASATSSSGKTKGSSQRNATGKSDAFPAGPGVMSMLRTTTELGDIGSLAIPSRNSGFNRNGQRHSGGNSRASGASTTSQTAGRRSNHHAWPSASSGPRRSITSNLTVPDQLLSQRLGIRDGPLAMPSAIHPTIDGRSFSLTAAMEPPSRIPIHRSMTSLRNHEPIARPRSPYIYPTRLKRPGYRAPSPALSDMTGMPQNRPHGHGYGHRPGPMLRQAQMAPLGHHQPPSRIPYYSGRNRSTPTVSTVGRLEASATKQERGIPQSSGHAQPPIVAPAPLRPRPKPHPLASQDMMALSPPSSSTTPPTPTDDYSTRVMVSPNTATEPTVFTQAIPGSFPVTPLDDGPAYYDYSEAFYPPVTTRNVQRPPPAPRSPPVPMGMVHRIRALLEERTTVDEAGHAINGVNPVGVVAELPAGQEVAELPGDAMPHLTRHVVLAAIGPDSQTMESIAHLITHVREEDAGENRPSEDGSANGSTSTGKPSKDTPSKRLSAISEAPSGASQSTTHSAAIEFAIRYSMPTSIPASDSHSEFIPDPDGSDGLPSTPEEDATTSEAESSKGDHTPRASVADFNTIDTVDVDTGSIKIATEVVFERKNETLSVVEPRGTPERTKSLALPVSSSSKNSSSRYSVPTSRTTWSNDDASSQGSPSDVAIRISLPPTAIPHKPSPLRISAVTSRDAMEVVAELPADDVKPPVVVTITESTGVVNPVPPVSPLLDDKSLDRRDSPVSPMVLPEPGPVPPAIPPKAATRPLVPTEARKLTVERDSYLDGGSLHETQGSISTNGAPPLYRNSSDSSHEKTRSNAKDQDMSISNLRLSALRNAAGAVAGLVHLRDESTDETSMSDFRISNFKFPPVPGKGRRASFESATGRMSRESARTGPWPPRTSSKGLKEAREIPSLEFSSINLVERLNDALGHRRSASVDGIVEDTAKQDDVRVRYRSFFKEWDEEMDVSTPVEDNGDALAVRFLGEEMDDNNPGKTQTDEKATDDGSSGKQSKSDSSSEGLEKQSLTARLTAAAIKRPLSPQEAIDEVNRLEVPDVWGLTQRLSELIPGRRRYHSHEDITDDQTVDTTLNEIRGLGRRRIVRADGKVISLVNMDPWVLPDRAPSFYDASDTDAELTGSKRSSAATATASGDVTTTDGTDERRSSAATQKTSGTATTGAETSSTHKTPLAELEAPLPVIVRGRSLTDSYGVVRHSSHLLLGAHDPRHSLAVTGLIHSPSFEARPWNFDVSYPWAGSYVPIDISFPPPTFQRDSPGEARPSKLRVRISDPDADGDDDQSDDQSTIKATDDKDGDGATDEATGTTEDTFNGRKSTRRSVLGSVKRKLGNTLSSHSKADKGNPGINITGASPGASFDNAGFPLSPDLLSLREDERTVDPGDRYPTTGLSPPNAFNLDEVRSFFSDDSSIRGHDNTRSTLFGKRITSLGVSRLKMGMTRAASAMDHRTLKLSDAVRSDSPHSDSAANSGGRRANGVRSAASARSGARGVRHLRLGGRDALGLEPVDGAESPSLTTGYDGSNVVGMGKTEFRARKFVERIKVLWFKSGELIRSISGRGRRDSLAERRNGDDSDVYSGT